MAMETAVSHVAGLLSDVPRHVGDDEEGDDGDGDVGHVELPPVPFGPPLVEDANPAANAQVEDDQRERGRQARCGERVQLKGGGANPSCQRSNTCRK